MARPYKRKYNFKLHVLPDAEYKIRAEELTRMAESADYNGNAKHKKNPGDFGLDPPAAPRELGSLCDNVGIFKKSVAKKLLKAAFKLGLIDARTKSGDWPQTVWMVWQEQHVVQGMFTGIGHTYHGFYVNPGDPICEEVKKFWESRK